MLHCFTNIALFLQMDLPKGIMDHPDEPTSPGHPGKREKNRLHRAQNVIKKSDATCLKKCDKNPEQMKPKKFGRTNPIRCDMMLPPKWAKKAERPIFNSSGKWVFLPSAFFPLSAALLCTLDFPIVFLKPFFFLLLWFHPNAQAGIQLIEFF